MIAPGTTGPWIALRDLAAPMTPELIEPPAPPPFGETLRVVTFNVENRTRADALVAAFRGNGDLRRADIVLLQEIEAHPSEGRSRAGQLAAELGMGLVYAPSRLSGDDGTHGQAILSRWPLHDPEMMALLRLPLPFNPRRCIALAAQIETPAGRLRLTTVHLDTRINLATRVRQLAPALDAAHPLQIVGGDMNTLPFQFAGLLVPFLPTDQAGGLDAHMRGLGFATPVSRAGATHRHIFRVRLDAIFTRGFAPAAAQVARDIRISDHYPVWVDLEWPRSR